MKQTFQTKRFKTLLSYFLLALAIIAAYKMIMEISFAFTFAGRMLSIISPFIYGFIMAYILNIPCGGIQKLLRKSKSVFIYRRRKSLSIIITYILLFLTVVLVLRLVIPYIYSTILFFIANLPTYITGAQNILNYVNDMNIINYISVDEIIRDFSWASVPSSINAVFGGVSTALFRGFLMLVSSIYILIEKEKIKLYACKLFKAFSSDTVYNRTLKYLRDLNNNFKQYIYTQTLDGVILGTIVTIELIILGSPFALVLGIMLGIVNYIPYFGSIIGTIAAIIVVAFTQGLPRAAIAAVVLLITQQIDGNVIQPKLMGGSFSLSPLLVIICITIGGAFAGILGMIVAIPIVAVMKNMLDEIVAHCESQKPAEPLEPAEEQR